MAGDLVSTLVVPAVVAAIVALTFEVLFKPALEVRKDRRVSADQSLRRSADGLRQVASRLHVVSTLDRHDASYGLKLLWTQLERLESQLDVAQESLVSAPEVPRPVALLASHGLGRGLSSVLSLRGQLSRDLPTHGGSLDKLVRFPTDDLLLARDELTTAADFMDAPRRSLIRRARLLLSARELVENEQEEIESEEGQVVG